MTENANNDEIDTNYLAQLEKWMCKKLPNSNIKGSSNIEKRQCHAIQEMLAPNASGFGWNDNTKCIICDVTAFNDWVKISRLASCFQFLFDETEEKKKIYTELLKIEGLSQLERIKAGGLIVYGSHFDITKRAVMLVENSPKAPYVGKLGISCLKLSPGIFGLSGINLSMVLEMKRAKFEDSIAIIKLSLKFMGPHIEIARASDTGKMYQRILFYFCFCISGQQRSGSNGAEPVLSPPPGFKPLEPKPFTVGEGQILDIITASLALSLRFGSGTFVLGYSSSIVFPDEIGPDEYALDVQGKKVKETCKLGPRPEKPIVIGEMFSCPFCRKVREMVSILALDVLFYPCPRNGPNFRPKVLQMGGKQQFTYMVDPNTGVAMYESDNIIKYLADKYGDGTVPLMLSLGFLTTLTAGLAMLPRMRRGSSYLPAKLPPQPLVYWAYEGSPFCRLVHEVLVELELPHLLRTVARGSLKVKKAGAI
ncbi:uncharacterized protein LOC120281096 [Dioscorea cayenensis subsp. rotundata]|uniref:Uncharacterized protein LOC120281096 n=1 Tax=Dioscorea cayennensis subsp. rotundata TaxID=55577 RepID=A0AB40D130_DIOCR|nr:uncharacterized protein LOC120281096 [Dioscorea cayenensis subsp. rotundata]